MLRPAFLLPGVPGLLTPRFGTEDLSSLRRPATRRSDAYRDGTSTRWRSAARRILPLRAIGVVTAHHARRLAGGVTTRQQPAGAAERPGPRAGASSEG